MIILGQEDVDRSWCQPVPPFTGDRLQIGGLDRDNDNIYRWLDGTPVSSGYVNWYPPNPSHGVENHMEILLFRTGEPWNDRSETYNRQYICESGILQDHRKIY